VRRYVLLVAYVQADGEAAATSVEDEHLAAHRAFEQYVAAHGRRISSAPLAGPDTATTLRHVAGAATVGDGPLVESVEQLGAYYDVELPDLDAAIAAGSLLPPTSVVEIRPTVTLEGREVG
jgi:hypothetical protein